MAGEAFEKDFGYLMPFLDRVAAAAGDLDDAAARQELQRLMEGEKQRWTRIRQLLSGAPGRAPAEAQRLPPAPAAASLPAAPPLAEASERPAFTVGSLRPRR